MNTKEYLPEDTPLLDAALAVENHGLTATEERMIEFIQNHGGGDYAFACTEDAQKMMVILD